MTKSSFKLKVLYAEGDEEVLASQAVSIENAGFHVTRAVGRNAVPELLRRDAFDIMIQHASEIGANAIIGVRYDTTEISTGVTEVLAYGTAVIVEPTDSGYRA